MSAFESTTSGSTLNVERVVTFRNRDIISLSRGCDEETFRGIFTCSLYSGVQSILDTDRSSLSGRMQARVNHIDLFEESFFSKFGVFLEDDLSGEENPAKRRRTDNLSLLPEFLILEKELAQCESYEGVFSLLSNISRCINKCREGNTHSRLQFLQLLDTTHGTPHEILSKLSAATMHTKGSNDNPDNEGQVKWRIELIEPALVDSTRQAFEEVFEMNAEVGKGGYGVVHKALCRPVNYNVAVKMLDRKKMDKKHEDGLRHEVKIMMDLSHPHIVKAYDLFGDSNSFYVVMELITGGELFDRIVRKTCYKEAEARQLARTLLGAIKYMHDHNIVHRDLKPENLLLTSDKNDFDIKVVDFGFATEVDGENLSDQFGTPGYIAPEILRAAHYGKGVDMWSFGVILYILLGGYPPFYDNDRAMLFKKIKTAAYEFHEGYWNEVSDDAKDLIRRLLVVDMKTRLTVDQALAHPWFAKRRELLESRVLSHSLVELRKFQARRKLRAGIRSVLAIARMQSMASKSAFLRDQLFNMVINKASVTSSTSMGSETVARGRDV